MKYSNNCGVFEIKYNLLNINNLESYIYIYIFLIINKLHKFFLFTFIYISKPPKSERCASLKPCAIRPAWLFIRN